MFECDQGQIRLAEPTFEPSEIEAVVAVLRSGRLVQGQKVAAFERSVCDYLGTDEAVATTNGTSALHVALLALELGPGDEVIVPDFTFPSMAHMVESLGATTIPVDIDLSTFNLDVDKVQGALSSRTRAIVPVHLFGLVAELGPLLVLANQYGIPVIEDAACALGATYPGRGGPHHVGTECAMACISYHPRKVMTTGEGGMVVTQNHVLAERMRRIRNQGAVTRQGRMTFEELGFNYRMTEIQAALGLGQLARLNGFIERRRSLASDYRRKLDGVEVVCPVEPLGFRHIYQSYIVLVPERVSRDTLMATLRHQGIECTIGTYALHRQPYYRKKYALTSEQFPNSSVASERSLALPLHPRMSEEDVDRVVAGLAEALRS